MEWRLCVDQASLGKWCGCEVEGFEMSSVRLLGRVYEYNMNVQNGYKSNRGGYIRNNVNGDASCEKN